MRQEALIQWGELLPQGKDCLVTGSILMNTNARLIGMYYWSVTFVED